MDLMQTPLGDEVMRVVNANQGHANFYIDATIHTKFGDVGVIRVLNYDVMREYTLQYNDELSITCVVPAGQYAYRVAPSRNELEITLSGSPIAQHGLEEVNAQNFGVQRFRAVLKEATDPAMEANARELLSEFTMDTQNFEIIEFQLFSKAMEQFSMRGAGGLYRKTKVGDLIRAILLQQSAAVDVDDDYKPQGVDMVEPKDEQVRDHIVLPHGVMAYDAPGYIHKHCGGVYSAGLAYYYQDDYWYVFPPFDYKRFEEASRQLVILVVPENKMPAVDNTYIVEGSVTTIIATGGLHLDDNSDLKKRTTGNGIRFADASKFFESGVETKGNKALMSRGKLNNEFLSSPQKSEFNNVQMAPDRISANTMYQASLLAAKEGVHLQLGWQNADPSLIKPGMQTKIFYFKEGTVRQVYGIVIGAQSATGYEGTGLVTGRYNRNMGLHIFCANEANQADS
ncbi:putative virion structural protein [Ralstonia phage RP31]|uniref:Putative virion structural protein n=2 Tax=Ripduovirus RP12 TaxID=2560700 RepID=A0A1L7N156_9CAUD|nr:putative virion structural protein [Ralstonia phage RP12]BAW19205.1 putative virion structural protein [Ralstonia phage RP12]BAW19491.1 putative virion structural protein [Ralstonia phage RP31]